MFLPAAGNRNGTFVDDVGDYGYYWSSTAYYDLDDFVWSVSFNDDHVNPGYANVRFYGQSVRLVCE